MRTNRAPEAPDPQPPLSPAGEWARTLVGAVALLSLLLATPPARASDGVIEINQAKALAGGVTPGDAPGFPVTLSQEGSYRLTGNLVVAGPSSAIAITVWNVSLDLGGFTVSGPNSCTGYPTTGCTVVGGEPGIWANANAYHVRVENGVVRNFNGHGVFLEGASSTAENLRVMINGGDGLRMGGAGRVIDCVSLANYRDGFALSNDGFVESCEARANGLDGIGMANGRVVQSAALSNKDYGILIANLGLVESTVARFNGIVGIFSQRGEVANCVAESNGGGGITLGNGVIRANHAQGNGSVGITGGTLVIDNVALSNAHRGILSADALVSRNVTAGNDDDLISGHSQGDNRCGDAFC